MLAYGKSYFGHLLGILDFSECIYICSVNGVLKKDVCWASVWDSGYQRTHMQIYGEIQFDNVYFLLGLLLKNGGL